MRSSQEERVIDRPADRRVVVPPREQPSEVGVRGRDRVLARITRWLGDGRDVLFSEFGLPTFREPAAHSAIQVEEGAAASYTQRVLAGLRDAGCSGAMLWCYADYAPEMWDDPPLDEAVHERSFGLWRADGSAKPAVATVSGAAGRSRAAPTGEGWIDIAIERFWEQPGVELARLYRLYRGSGPTQG